MLCYKCKNPTCDSPFKGIEAIECSNYTTQIIDWEQRRYEIAKDILAVFVANPSLLDVNKNPIDASVNFADALIRELKKK